jgi:hypothetical protein
VDEIDRLLVSEDAVSPSSGFTAGVMDAIAAAAAEPPPRPFPWVRFLAGVMMCAASAAGVLWLAETDGLGLPRTDATVAAFAAAKPQLEIAAATAFAIFAALRVRRALSW